MLVRKAQQQLIELGLRIANSRGSIGAVSKLRLAQASRGAACQGNVAGRLSRHGSRLWRPGRGRRRIHYHPQPSRLGLRPDERLLATQLPRQLAPAAHRYVIVCLRLAQRLDFCLQAGEIVSLRSGHESDIALLEIGQALLRTREPALVISDLRSQEVLGLLRALALATQCAVDECTDQLLDNLDADPSILVCIRD